MPPLLGLYRHRCRSPHPAHSHRPDLHRAPRSETVSQRRARRLNVERLAAAAATLLIGIVKGEPALEFRLYVVHFGTEDEHDGLRVDQNCHALVFDDLVKFALFVSVFERVAETRTAAGAHAYAHTGGRFTALPEQRLDPRRRSIRHRQDLLSRPHSYVLQLP